MRRGRVLVVASIGLLAGCLGKEPTVVVNLSGDLSFTYAGALSGNFNASGQMPQTTTEQRTTDWASGERSAGETFVNGAMPRTATTYDIAFIGIDRSTAGSATIGVDANVTILLGAPVSGTGQALQLCVLDAGTVVIATITATRVIGTLSGTGDCFDPGATATSVTVTSGTFDVPFVTTP